MAGKRPPTGRGRLSGIEQLPPDCDPLIAKASEALRDRERTQLEIYQEFVDGCRQLMAESHGELEFAIPSKSAFNRFSIRLAVMTRRLEETREIAGTIASRFDAEASDDLTLIAAEAIKTLVFEVLTAAGHAGVDPKGAMELARALQSAVQAQNVSTARKLKVEAEFAEKAEKAVKEVAKVKGITAEGAQEILAKILNVRAP